MNSIKTDNYWSFWYQGWSNHQNQEVLWWNRAFEVVEAIEVAEVFKAWKITMEDLKAILVLEFNNLRTKIISFLSFENNIFWQNYENSWWIFWQGLLRLAYVKFLKTGWWNSNFQTSRIYRYLQAKSDLHISICQRHFKRNISMWNTL